MASATTCLSNLVTGFLSWRRQSREGAPWRVLDPNNERMTPAFTVESAAYTNPGRARRMNAR